MNSYEKIEYQKHKNEIRIINISDQSEFESIELQDDTR